MGIGTYRMDALWRVVVGGLYLVLFVALILPILLTVGVVLGVIDVLWQLIFNSDGIMSSNLFTRAWETQLDNARWALFGSGDFQLALA